MIPKMLRNVSLVAMFNVAGRVVAYPLQILLAHIFGVAGYGKIALVLTWTNLLILPMVLGVDTALLKVVSIDWERRALARVRHTFLLAMRSVGINTVLIAVVIVALASLLPNMHPLFRDYYGFVLLIALLLSLLNMLMKTLRAVGGILSASVPRDFVLPSITILLILAYYKLLGANPSLGSYFTIYSASLALVIMVVVVFLVSAFSRAKRSHQAGKEPETLPIGYRKLMSLAVPMGLSSIMYVIHTQIDIFLIGAMLTDRDVGLYAAVVRITQLLYIPLTAVLFYIVPKFATLHAEGRRKDLQRLVDRSVLLITATTMPLSLGVIFFAGPILGLFGTEFKAAAVSLVILSLGHMANSLAGPTGNLMNMTGYQKEAAIILAVSNLLNIVLNIIGIRIAGIAGAAAATALTTLAWNGAMIFVIHRKLKISIFHWLRNLPGVIRG